MEDGIQKLIDAWPRSVVAPAMDLNNPLVIYDSMYNMLVNGGVKRDASPGYPGLIYGPTNEDVIGFHTPEYISAVATERILLLGEINFSLMEGLSGIDCVKLGLTDPIRLFIKNEPHSKEKMASGRYRLINSVSLIDQMVEKYLCGRQNKVEIANYALIPSMSGMGNHQTGLTGAVKTKHLIEQILNRAGTDARAFDWTCTHQTMMIDPRFRAQVLGLPTWENHYTKRQLLLITSAVIIDDGSVYNQVSRGVQKSGSANTSGGNSRNRVVARAIALPEMPLVINGEWQVRAMGDDCAENIGDLSHEQVKAAYRRQNVQIKLVTSMVVDGFVEFCGLEFSETGIYNPRALKTVNQFLLTWPEPSQWDTRFTDFCDALHYCPRECRYYGQILLLVREALASEQLWAGEDP